MCISLSSPVEAVKEPMDAPPAPFLFSQTLGDSESVAEVDGYFVQAPPTGGGSTLPGDSGVYGKDAPREDPGVSSLSRQINDDSTSLVATALATNSPVCAVSPVAWCAPQGSCLLPESDGSKEGESASEVVPNKPVGAGLLNLGNTCFLNAILQCFTHTVPLVQGLRLCTHDSPCVGHMDGFCVICALRNQVESSFAASGRILSPLKIVNNLNYFSSEFRRYQQEDAHEFMQCALDKLERCFLDLRKSNLNFEDDNLVEKVFGGRLISRLQCSSCDRTSDTYEPLIDMSLEIENVDSLPSALESFTMVENIDANFRCDSCKEEVSMEKQLMLEQTPSVATFHLKRFKTDGIYVEKIDKHIDFPLELDLQPYTISHQNNDVPLKYDLYAIVVHTGFSSTSGHYFCFVRSAPDTWHKLDDSMVTEVSGDSVLSQEAYILFYARQGTPWFSSIMGSQTQCLDPNIMSTSPKSVLDVGDSMYKSNPNLIPNIEGGRSGESIECSELLVDYYCEEPNYLELNDTIRNSSIGCGQFPSGSNQESVDLNGFKDVDAQVPVRNSATLDGSGMYVGNSHIENGGLDNNYNCPEVVDFRENAGFHSLSPPSTPSDDATTDKFYITRDNLKREKKHGSCKRQSNKFVGDSERRAAVKSLNKMHGSRRGALLKFVNPKEDLDKKRKKMDSSLCKESGTLGGRKNSNHRSVSRPVAAGPSQ